MVTVKVGVHFETNGKILERSDSMGLPEGHGDEFIEDTEDHITQEAIAESATNLIPPNSLLVVTRSGI